MSYVLIYSDDGHELSSNPLDSLDDVNNEIRDIYDRNDEHVAILRIEQDHDGPRTWAIECPPAPPAGTRVRDKHGTIRTVGEEGALRFKGEVHSWKGALNEIGPLTEVVETEVEAAARRLRENGAANNPNWRLWQDEHSKDVRTVLAHVLNGGTL